MNRQRTFSSLEEAQEASYEAGGRMANPDMNMGRLANELRNDLKASFPGRVKSVRGERYRFLIEVVLFAQDEAIEAFIEDWVRDRQVYFPSDLGGGIYGLEAGFQHTVTWLDVARSDDGLIKALLRKADELAASGDRRGFRMARALVDLEQRHRAFRLAHGADPIEEITRMKHESEQAH